MGRERGSWGFSGSTRKWEQRAGKYFGEPGRQEEGLPEARRIEGGDEGAGNGVKARGLQGTEEGRPRPGIPDAEWGVSHLCRR